MNPKEAVDLLVNTLINHRTLGDIGGRLTRLSDAFAAESFWTEATKPQREALKTGLENLVRFSIEEKSDRVFPAYHVLDKHRENLGSELHIMPHP